MPTYNRSVTFNNQRISEPLRVNGSFKFNNLQVQNDVHINGSVHGSILQCQQLGINGSVHGDHITCQYLDINGPVTVEHVNCRNLKIDGSFTGTDITATEQGSINGSCTVNGFNVNNTLKIRGKAIGQRWDIRGNAEINGCLKASDQSRFTNIDLCSYDSSLEHSTANNIVIKRCTPVRPQILRLSQGTVINGNVTFEDGQGVIYVDSTSRVTGTVTGGRVITDDRLARSDQVTFYNTNTATVGLINISWGGSGTRYVNYVNGREVAGDSNNFGNRTIVILPPIWLIAALLIGTIASFALGGPLWLGVTLAILTALCAGGKLVGKIIRINSKVDEFFNSVIMQPRPTPNQTTSSHQVTPTPNAGPSADQTQTARPESQSNNPPSSGSPDRPRSSQ